MKASGRFENLKFKFGFQGAFRDIFEEISVLASHRYLLEIVQKQILEELAIKFVRLLIKIKLVKRRKIRLLALDLQAHFLLILAGKINLMTRKQKSPE